MVDLGGAAQRTADQLAEGRAGVVVAALAGGGAEVRSAGAVGTDSVFELGSVSKVFTSLALACLVTEGLVGLDEPLAELLPEAAGLHRGGEAVTLRQLAQHTSGLSRLPPGMLLPALLHPGRPDPYARFTEPVLLGTLRRVRLGAVPGKRFRYSNLGAGLLGLALSRRAGTDYEQLIAARITGPLGLTDTAVVPADPARLVQGHDRRGRPVPGWDLAALAGAGGLRGTAADLVTFLQAQFAPEQTPLAEAIALSRTPEHRTNPFSWIHLGWMGLRLHPRQGGQLQLWHNGGTGGFASFLGFAPECGTGVVVLTNTQRSVDGSGGALLTGLSAAAQPSG
ncbi:serine hydrolase domain-containing protein [Kitasatospora sp. NPDC002040]|uniref:serine hydrolase domain-containing protein n=1 Tax=Kitasatospora sp. NPDC002040 TaxID=3154661 RepID=UPI003321011D